MSETSSSDTKRRKSGVNPLRLLAFALLIAAVIKELRLPKDQRTWHGSLFGFVPYDFRMPTFDKIKNTFWNPQGKLIVNRAFGVGWTVNAGAIVAKVRSSSSAA
jgi:hypothetical protein